MTPLLMVSLPFFAAGAWQHYQDAGGAEGPGRPSSRRGAGCGSEALRTAHSAPLRLLGQPPACGPEGAGVPAGGCCLGGVVEQVVRSMGAGCCSCTCAVCARYEHGSIQVATAPTSYFTLSMPPSCRPGRAARPLKPQRWRGWQPCAAGDGWTADCSSRW